MASYLILGQFVEFWCIVWVMGLVWRFINFPAHYSVSHHLNNGLTVAVVILGLYSDVLIVFGLLWLVAKCLQNRSIWQKYLNKSGVGPLVCLELVFPASNTKASYATEQLQLILSSQTKIFSLELVATHKQGVRYVLVISKEKQAVIRRSLLSFLPSLQIKTVSDYASKLTAANCQVIQLKLNDKFVLPLKSHKSLAKHDPMAYLTGQMTKLTDSELIACQLVVSRVKPSKHPIITRQVRVFEQAIAKNEVIAPLLKHRFHFPELIWFIFLPPIWLAIQLGKFVWSLPKLIRDPNSPSILFFRHKSPGKRPKDNRYEQQLSEDIKSKLEQPLFEVSFRLMVYGSTDARRRTEALVDALSPFTSNKQSLGVQKRLKSDSFSKRVMISRFLNPNVLSVSELADLYHFPHTQTKTEGLVKGYSKQLPLPISQRQSADFDITLGTNAYGGNSSPIGLTLNRRRKHLYIIGQTGTGKTTLLINSIYQDMLNGKGLAVLDPHGDMFKALLELVPKSRIKDVVVFDPSDRDYPIGLNILDPGVDFASLEEKQEWITAGVISVFARLTAKKYWGPKMEHILRSACLTALQLPNPSLYTIQHLLTNRHYAKQVAASLDDPILAQFWQDEMAHLGDMQLANTVAPLTHRLGHFITTKSSRHILLQPKSTLSISDILSEGKILLVNLSKGALGEDQSRFFGTLMTSLIWMAAYQRVRIAESKRPDFFVYVDEFQNFATPQFAEIASEGRKFHLPLILSHQNTAQVEDKGVVRIVTGNAGTLVCFKASPVDEELMLPFYLPEVERGDITHLPLHHFYMSSTGKTAEAAFSGQTELLGADGSRAVAKQVISYSRKHYGTPRTKVQTELQRLLLKGLEPIVERRAEEKD